MESLYGFENNYSSASIITPQKAYFTPKHRTSHFKCNIFRNDFMNDRHNHANTSVAIFVAKYLTAIHIPTPNAMKKIVVSVNIPQLHNQPITMFSIYIPLS